mmetsp:Transcript_27939/g.42226  ORF Transcript_27939/g.42226 Transcript_27939/m.42226 type:complete len:85 (-) Transcript_27939:255-509(-)
MITKQQKFIEDYDIVGSSSHDKNLELFLGEGNDQDINIEDPEADFNTAEATQNLKSEEAFTPQDPNPGNKGQNIRELVNGGKGQ